MIVPGPENAPDQVAIYMIVNGNKVLQSVPEDAANILPQLDSKAVASLWQHAAYRARIGTYQGTPVYLLDTDEPVELAGFELLPLRQLLHRVDSQLFALAGRACQVAYFIRTHLFCSQCGQGLEEVTDELAVYCRTCDYRTYPRISPCIIVAVYRGHGDSAEILLAHGVRHPEGLYSVLAGFVESGETLEQCLAREVFEETGVDVECIEYVMSQPWPFPHSLMMGFTARYRDGDVTPDGNEVLAANWFTFNALPKTPPPGTIAAQLIDAARTKCGC